VIACYYRSSGDLHVETVLSESQIGDGPAVRSSPISCFTQDSIAHLLLYSGQHRTVDGCWLLVERPVRLLRRYVAAAAAQSQMWRTSHNPYCVLRCRRGGVLSLQQTAVPPKWTAYQCPPAAIVPLQRHWRQQRLAAAVVVVTSTPSSRKEDVPDMATAPRDMDRSERLHRRAQGLEACERSSELLGAVHPRAHRQEERATGQIRCWSLVVHYNPAHDSGAGSTIFC
jgi:hypothetical protein